MSNKLNGRTSKSVDSSLRCQELFPLRFAHNRTLEFTSNLQLYRATGQLPLGSCLIPAEFSTSKWGQLDEPVQL